jgi:signal transduction histidine kinase
MLTVRDDGHGFDPTRGRHGYGVLGMEERARLLGGQLEVDSAPGRGTEVRLRFPTPA